MAKLACLLALFVVVVVCAEAKRIDIAEPPSIRGKVIPGVKKDDPRCKNRTGTFPYPGDCTRYIKCVNGDSQEKKCPEDYKFDSVRHCVPPSDNPDCGKTLDGPVDAAEKCPEKYGYFPVESDCHKYMICVDGIPKIKECPPKHVYSIIGACVEGDKCPKQSSEESICKRANQLLPDEQNCRRYIKCVNFKPIRKECPPGTAFDPRKRRCTKEQLDKCKNNHVLSVEPDE